MGFFFTTKLLVLDSSRLWALALFNICMTACFVPEMFWFLMEEGVSAAIMCSSRSAICFLLQPQISINCFYPKKKKLFMVFEYAEIDG